MRHCHRQCDRDLRLNEPKLARGDGNAGLTTRIDAIKARRLGGRTDRNPQVDVAQIALRPFEFEYLAPDFGAVTAAATQSRATERMISPLASSIELNIVLPHRNSHQKAG